MFCTCFRTISTLKGELVPHLVRSQFTTKTEGPNESDMANPNTSVTGGNSHTSTGIMVLVV